MIASFLRQKEAFEKGNQATPAPSFTGILTGPISGPVILGMDYGAATSAAPGTEAKFTAATYEDLKRLLELGENQQKPAAPAKSEWEWIDL